MSGKPNDKMFKTMTEKLGSENAARAYFAEIGARGGSAPTDKLKGWAYIKANNPEKFKALSHKGGLAKKPRKT